MWKRVLLACSLCLLLAGCGETEQPPAEPVDDTPAVQMAGGTVSPDGRFEVRSEGETKLYVGDERVPEQVQILEDGEVRWSMEGAVNLSALWSADSRFVAISYGGRTWNAIRVVETENWTEFDYTLPEYTFLREGWGQWIDENSMDITAEGTQGEERYRYSVVWSNAGLEGSVLKRTGGALGGEYDFDHNGVLERAEVVTFWETEEDRVAWYELRIGDWSQEAAEAHVGWTSIFALEIDGQDYLLRYDPSMGQGAAYYGYQIFSLDENGEEMLYKENGVEFDINFGSPVHQSYDPAAIAAFLYEVHGYLDQATLLISTEGGEFVAGGSGADFTGDDFHGGNILASNDWEAALREYQKFAEAERG